jgi:phosphoribosyl 1,2-cyclic phosphodiesterase
VPLRFASLGSGSSGNGLVVECGRTRVMMDCGFSIAETRERLERAGLAPSNLAGIVVTHEHDDHLGGVAAFAVPHDAREPVQYTFSDGAAKLGVVTDLGCVTQHVVDCLSGCEALVIECNHDLDMLMGGSYPFGLKQRVSGRFGHLSNSDAGHLVSCLDRSKLRHLIAAHLSQQNNRAELARAALAKAAGCEDGWVGVATQADGFGWREA